MTHIRIISPMLIGNRNVATGDVLAVDPARARREIEAGRAVVADPDAPGQLEVAPAKPARRRRPRA